MEFTGERFVPGQGGAQIAYEHLLRYLFAREAVAGKRVLDLGSGEGYGAFLLAQDARQVIGIDLSPEAVAHAASKYAVANLFFSVGSILAVPLDAGRAFDVITCFEVIEHVADPEAVVAECKRLLRPGGVLFVSTPNKKTYSDDPKATNPFHLKELYFHEFRDLLKRHFPQVLFYGQHLAFGASIWNLSQDVIKPRIVEHVVRIEPDGLTPFQSVPPLGREPLYFIAVCSDGPIPSKLIYRSLYLNDPSRSMLSEFFAARAAVQGELDVARRDRDRLAVEVQAAEAERERVRAATEAMEADLNQSRQQELALRVEAEAQGQRAQTLSAEIAHRKEQLKAVEADIAAHQQVVATLQARLGDRDRELRDLQAQLAAREQAAAGLRAQLSDRDRQLREVRAQLTERVRQLGEITTRVAAQDQDVARLQGLLTERDHRLTDAARVAEQLRAIEASGGWRLLGRMRAWRFRLIPVGSSRERVWDLWMRFIHAWMDHGLWRAMAKGTARLRPKGGDALHSPPLPPPAQGKALPQPHEVSQRGQAQGLELTIICASYKRYNTIHVLINSLLCQTLRNWKLVVIHDGPDEQMASLVRQYQKDHPNIEFMHTEERFNDFGHSLREIGLRMAQTEFVMFTNDDNYYAPKFVAYMFEAIRRDRLDLVLCNMIHSHRNPGPFTRDDYLPFDSYPMMKFVDIGNFIVRRRIAQEVGFEDRSFAADGVFIDKIMSHYDVVNLIPGWRWKLALLRRKRRGPGETIRVGKVNRVLFVHN